jgi:esterase/lipase
MKPITSSPSKCQPELKWFPAENPSQRSGVALVVHGLNLRPNRMKGIIGLLNTLGIDAALLSLTGHGDAYLTEGIPLKVTRLESFKKVTYPMWQQEIVKAYQAVRTAAGDSLPLFLVGYSLGGLLSCDLMISRPDIKIDKMVLLAPALIPRGLKLSFFKLLSPFSRTIIPSRSPASYRANRGTPLAAYQSLFQAVDHFHKNLNSKLNIPTLIFMDKWDELVSYKKTKSFIVDKNLTQWQLQVIKNNKNSVNQGFRHLIVDSLAVGTQNWELVEHSLTTHLKNH